MIDYLIKNGLVVDGSGREGFKANVCIKGDIIVYVGSDSPPSERVIDAEGLVVCPGFVDTHAHSEFTLLADGRAEGKLSQGVTTEINGNCGLSAAPLYGEAADRRESDQNEYGISERWATFEEYYRFLSSDGIGLNFATLCGHGNIRASVMGYRDGRPSVSELNRMKELLSDSIMSGARGLTTGLIYPPGVYSETGEIVDLAKTAVKLKPSSIYATHMRSEGDELVESIEEAIAIGRESGVAVHISHIKTAGEENWGKIDSVLSLIDEARSTGMRITCDRYPYIASSTDLDTIIPSWAYEGGVQEELKRLKDPTLRKKIIVGLEGRSDRYWKSVYISSVSRNFNKWMEGKNIFDIASELGKRPSEAALDIIISEEARAGAIFFSMREENLRRFLSLPYVMIGSDSSVRSFSGVTRRGKPHPRAFGCFPRFISRYVRDEGLLTLPEAIRKITSLPADIFGLERRGLLRAGYFADVTVFSLDAISDRATFQDPYQSSDGIIHVFVNGEPAYSEGVFSGKLNGRIIR